MRNHKVDIRTFEVYSNYNSTPPNLAGGIAQLDYVESLLYYSPKVNVLFADTGSRVSGEQVGGMENDGIKFVGAEKIYLKLEDPYQNRIDFDKSDKFFKTKNARTIAKNVFTSSIQLELWSKECEDNQNETTRVRKTYEGKISDNVKTILKEVLKTEKNIDDIEETLNPLKFNGGMRKPFVVINDLCLMSVPTLTNSYGNTAGFWFWEDNRGYHFKSIDYLMSQSAKKKYIMRDIVDTESVPLPPGYDDSIKNAIPIKNFDIEEILETASLSSSKIETFTNLKSDFKPNVFDTHSKQQEYIAGKEFPIFNGLENETTRRYVQEVTDLGFWCNGKSLDDQLKSSKEINFDKQKILRQSESRIRNMFSVKLVIKIKCDLSLHPGDMIHCDFRERSLKTEQEISNKESGLYIIVTIRHKITTDGDHFSIIDLVRDSIGRKPMKL